MSSNIFDVGSVSHVGAVALSRRIINQINDGHFPRQVICASERAKTLKGLSCVSESGKDFTISGHSASLLWIPPCPTASWKIVFEPSQGTVGKNGI